MRKQVEENIRVNREKAGDSGESFTGLPVALLAWKTVSQPGVTTTNRIIPIIIIIANTH